MMMKYIYSLALIFLLIFGCKTRNIDTVTAQKIPYNDSLAKELSKMVRVDQNAVLEFENRISKLSPEQLQSFQDSVFAVNHLRVKDIFDEHGFVGYDLAGREGSRAFWLLVQHSDINPKFQRKVLSKMKIEVSKGNANSTEYGLLVDRVNINKWVNAGMMTGDGWEVTLSGTPIMSENFNWNTTLNWSKSETVVEQLAPGIERLFLAGFGTAGTYLVEGLPYGAIVGGAYLREEAGTASDTSLSIPGGAIVIDPDTGYQAIDNTQRVIGDPNPDFILGWNNSFTYKNLTLNFLFDWKKGGDIWNGTAWALSFFGRSELTAQTREETPFVIDGVLPDGSGGFSPNNIPIVRDRSYWTSNVGGFGSVGEQFVEDGGWVRLRELSLSYNFSNKLFKNVPLIESAYITFTGRNLWLDAKYDGVDPETSLTGNGNGQGFDYFNNPGTKSYMFKVGFNF